MAREKFTNLEEMEGRHPGMCAQIEAMFEAFISPRLIAAAIEGHYGERIGEHTLWDYKREYWKARRAEMKLPNLEREQSGH